MSVYTGKYARRFEAAEARMETAAGYMREALEAIMLDAIKQLSLKHPGLTLIVTRAGDWVAISVLDPNRGFWMVDESINPALHAAHEAWSGAVEGWGTSVLPERQEWMINNGRIL